MDLKSELGSQYNKIADDIDSFIEYLPHYKPTAISEQSVFEKRQELKGKLRKLLNKMHSYSEVATKIKGSPVYEDHERRTILKNVKQNLDGWLERLPNLHTYLEELPFLSDEYARKEIINPTVEEINKLKQKPKPDKKLIKQKIDQLYQYLGYNFEKAEFDKEFKYPFRYGDSSFEYWYNGVYPVFVDKVEKEIEKWRLNLLPAYTLDVSDPREAVEHIFDTCLSGKFINPADKRKFIDAFTGQQIVSPITWLQKKGQLASMIDDLKKYVIEDQKNDWKRAEALFTSENFDMKKIQASATVNFPDFDSCRKYLKDLR